MMMIIITVIIIIMIIIVIIIIIAELHARKARLSIQENLVKTSAYDLPSVQTLGEGEGSQKSARPGEGVCYS